MRNPNLLDSFDWGKIALSLSRRVRAAPAAVLLALLMFVVVSGVILFASRVNLNDSTFALLFIVYMFLVFAVVMLLAIRVLTDSEPEVKGTTISPNLTEISGRVTLNGAGVSGARVRLLTANGVSTQTDQDGLFSLPPDLTQSEWQIKGSYTSRTGITYEETITLRREDISGKVISLVLHPAADSVEKTILDKLIRLKDHMAGHRQKIEEVAAPLIDDDNLIGMVERFNDLVQHHEPWSEPYSTLLYGGINLKEIQLSDAALQKSLEKAIDEVKAFQDLAFIQYQSLLQKSLCYDAANLYREYVDGTSNNKLRDEVGHSLSQAFALINPDLDRQNTVAVLELNTAHDVQEVVKRWCRSWISHLQAVASRGFLASAITSFEDAIARAPEP